MELLLDSYEAANLREGLLFLRHVGGDTGDWLGQILFKLEPVQAQANKSCDEQVRALAQRVGWKLLYG